MIELHVHLQRDSQPDSRLKNHSNSLENPWEHLNIQQNIFSPVTARQSLNLVRVQNVWESCTQPKCDRLQQNGNYLKKMKYDLKMLVSLKKKETFILFPKLISLNITTALQDSHEKLTAIYI